MRQVGGFGAVVIIRTMHEAGESFPTGTLAGAGCFRCDECGYAVALHEGDEVPTCPHCASNRFKRSSIFGEFSLQEPIGSYDERPPEWLEGARKTLERAGSYLAYEQDGHVSVVALKEGWTRIGRSLSADIRFDDPTVSRRHALLHVQGDSARILDDRSLNGVFVRGERVDMRELCDGDELAIGRFRLYFVALADHPAPEPPLGVGTAVS